MAGRRVHFVFPVGLVERVDAVLGPGQSRGEWVRGAVEQALGESDGPARSPSGASRASRPAPAEQPEEAEQREEPEVELLTTPEVRRRYDATMAPQAREFRPYPKGGGG